MNESKQNEAQYNKDFVKEQYAKYHQTRRQLNGFSWQLPSIAALAVLLFTGLDEKKLKLWSASPEIPATGFLVLSIFLSVLLVFHIRNITFLRNFERILTKMEQEYGVSIDVYAEQLDNTLPWWQRIRASVLLGLFIALLTIFSICMSIYFWVKFSI